MAAAGSARNSKSKSVEKEGEPEVMEVDGEQPKGDDVDDEEEEEEGEYEVEALVDHRQKKGAQSGKYEYLVAWKGYGAEHNTWEPEEHLSHADDQVKEYWNKRPKPSLQKVKRPRRQSNAGASSSTPVPASQRNHKSAKSSNGKRKAAHLDDDLDDDVPEFDDTHVDSSEKYQDVANWEETVQQIDTIERSRKDELTVYMTMIGGERLALPTDVAYKRCPQKVSQ
ncbi:hypothetical protein I317_05485 [Kwoniella heveanensis CBS 569]|nr:hypothetical protein I317_05485 [Kwoniella heveanensis CBS 569]